MCIFSSINLQGHRWHENSQLLSFSKATIAPLVPLKEASEPMFKADKMTKTLHDPQASFLVLKSFSCPLVKILHCFSVLWVPAIPQSSPGFPSEGSRWLAQEWVLPPPVPCGPFSQVEPDGVFSQTTACLPNCFWKKQAFKNLCIQKGKRTQHTF